MTDPKFIHALDQLTGAMSQLAEMLWSYFRSLQEQGFTREEALSLVIVYQQMLLTSIDPTE